MARAPKNIERKNKRWAKKSKKSRHNMEQTLAKYKQLCGPVITKKLEE